MSCITSFIASVVLLMSVSICWVWFSVKVAINSSIASACSSIALALNYFAVSLFGLFLRAYSAEMKVLMIAHVFVPCCFVLPFAHHRIKFFECFEVIECHVLELVHVESDVVSCECFHCLFDSFEVDLRILASLSARSVFVSAKSNTPPLTLRWLIICLGVWFKNPSVLSSISTK